MPLARTAATAPEIRIAAIPGETGQIPAFPDLTAGGPKR